MMLRLFQYYVGDQVVLEDGDFFITNTTLKALEEEEKRNGTNRPVRFVVCVQSVSDETSEIDE